MWYSVNQLYVAKHDDSNDENELWEEVIILINADSENDAIARCLKTARDREVTFDTATGGTVQWTFDSTACVCEIKEEILTNGTELFSRFLKRSEVLSMRSHFD